MAFTAIVRTYPSGNGLDSAVYFPFAVDNSIAILRPVQFPDEFIVDREGEIIVGAAPGIDIIANLQKGRTAITGSDVYVEKQDNGFLIKFQPPGEGKYDLVIFGKKETDESGKYSGAILLPFTARTVNYPYVPYPKVYSAFHTMPVRPADPYPGIIQSEGEIVLNFLAPREIVLFASLSGKNKKPVEYAVSVQPTQDGYSVKAAPPDKGSYTLSISAKRKDSQKASFDVLLEYQINQRDQPKEQVAYPSYLSQDNEYLSVAPAESYPKILLCENQLSLHFLSSHDTILYASLYERKEKPEINSVSVQPVPDGYTVRVAPPHKGTYVLSIAVRKKGKPGSSLRVILEYQVVQKRAPVEHILYPSFLAADDEYIIDYDPTEIARSNPAFDYGKIDVWVQATPKDKEDNLDNLVQYLLEPARNDFERTRAIFDWIANNISYAIDEYLNNINDASVADWPNVFKRRKGICAGYVNLFNAMCTRAKITSASINGIAKGYGYRESDDSTANHSWSGVELDGKWYLLDVTWGAGHIQDRRFIKAFHEQYFLTTPDTMICNHLPEIQKWQLLDHPISFKEFKASACDK